MARMILAAPGMTVLLFDHRRLETEAINEKRRAATCTRIASAQELAEAG